MCSDNLRLKQIRTLVPSTLPQAWTRTTSPLQLQFNLKVVGTVASQQLQLATIRITALLGNLEAV